MKALVDIMQENNKQLLNKIDVLTTNVDKLTDSNVELKSSNVELKSITEEMKSSNVALKTAVENMEMTLKSKQYTQRNTYVRHGKLARSAPKVRGGNTPLRP